MEGPGLSLNVRACMTADKVAGRDAVEYDAYVQHAKKAPSPSHHAEQAVLTKAHTSLHQSSN